MTDVRSRASGDDRREPATRMTCALYGERVMQSTSYPFATTSGSSGLPTAPVAPATNTFVEGLLADANDPHAVRATAQQSQSPANAAVGTSDWPDFTLCELSLGASSSPTSPFAGTGPDSPVGTASSNRPTT